MKENKLETITSLFENKEIRSLWDSEKEEYYFSVIDVVAALTDSKDPTNYWTMLKKRMTDEEKSELSTKCGQLRMKAADGKQRLTDTFDMEGIFRLIQSIPSPKAEPFKLWLAKLGKKEIDNVFDPSLGIDNMIDYYLKKGYTLEWIETRIKAIINRKKLTNVWQEGGISEGVEFAILTNEIYKTWSNMTAKQYKSFKGIRKESLRDNMTDVEVALTDLGEIATREIAKSQKPYGLEQNKRVARKGGNIAKIAKDSLESEIGKSIISKENNLNYKYIENEENELIETNDLFL